MNLIAARILALVIAVISALGILNEVNKGQSGQPPNAIILIASFLVFGISAPLCVYLFKRQTDSAQREKDALNIAEIELKTGKTDGKK